MPSPDSPTKQRVGLLLALAALILVLQSLTFARSTSITTAGRAAPTPPLEAHSPPSNAVPIELPQAPASLTLTVGTISMRAYVHNWLAHAERVPALRPYYAVALDEPLYRICRHTWRQPVLDASALLGQDGLAYNVTTQIRALRGYLRNEKAGFKLFGFVKARLLWKLLHDGYSVLLADADSVFLDDPWPWIGRDGTHGAPPVPPAADAGLLPAADVLLSNDYPDLRRDGQPDSVYNSGLLFVRSTKRAMRFVSEWAERTRRTAAIGNDQTELNRLLRGRYKDGHFECNHDGCLESDKRVFVPVAAAFDGPGCPPAADAIAGLRHAVARIDVDDEAHDTRGGAQAADGPCPTECTWLADPSSEDTYSNLTTVSSLRTALTQWHRCEAHQRGRRRRALTPARQLFWLWEGRVRFGLLPMERFLQGHTFFVQRLHHARHVTPVHVHVTYAMGADFGKEWRLRSAGLWRAEPPSEAASPHAESANVDAPGRPSRTKYLHLNGVDELVRHLLERMDLPREIWECGPPPKAGGDQLLLADRPSPLFEAVGQRKCFHPRVVVPTRINMQTTNLTAAMDPATPHMALQRLVREIVRNAFALAFATGRTLVLPPMWALCERHWWQLKDCRTPGVESLPLPYDAPLDIAFDVLRWASIRGVGFVEQGYLAAGAPGIAHTNATLLMVGAGSEDQAAGASSVTLGTGVTFDAAAATLTQKHPSASNAHVLELTVRSLLRFSPCGFDALAQATRFDREVLQHVMAGQYSYCSEERNPFVEALLREADATHVPQERLLISRRNCTGQPANDFNKPKVDLGATALAFRPPGTCGAMPAGVDGAEEAIASALAIVRGRA